MIEIEKTYLAKKLPDDLHSFPSKEMLDIYISANDPHPNLRIRKNGEKFEMTRKSPVAESDSSVQRETTIILSENEFNDLKIVAGKRVRKIRFDYTLPAGDKAEIDVFQDKLEGLVLVDIEFTSEEGRNSATMPDFCLEEVTQDSTFAGGMLSGKTYSDIEGKLKEYGYTKIHLA